MALVASPMGPSGARRPLARRWRQQSFAVQCVVASWDRLLMQLATPCLQVPQHCPPPAAFAARRVLTALWLQGTAAWAGCCGL